MNKSKYYIDQETEQINFLDQRFYKIGNEYFPSITFILQSYPKDQYFLDWLKQNGTNSDYIANKAANEGTQTHDLIERYLKGETLEWVNKYGEAKYSFNVWNMVLRFVEFWEEFNPTLIHTEVFLHSKKYKIGGTCDLILMLNNERWLIDLKTSNYLHKVYDLQVSAYVKCYEELYNEKIDRAGILWLKSSKRKLNREKISGKGWELYESSKTIYENWAYFKKVYDLFKLEHPNIEPLFNTLPSVIRRKD